MSKQPEAQPLKILPRSVQMGPQYFATSAKPSPLKSATIRPSVARASRSFIQLVAPPQLTCQPPASATPNTSVSPPAPVWSKYSSGWNQQFFGYELLRPTWSSCSRRKTRLAVICNVL
jgi:hypothetical protein